MTKPFDTRLVMMVAQKPFEHDLNQFCKLIPIVYVDGTRVADADFPNEGEIWWMLTATTARLAEPGRLVVGSIEDAYRYDEHDKTSSQYQVTRESVQELDMKDGLQVIDLAADAIEELEDVVTGGWGLNLAVRPLPTVMIRWRHAVYGPFFVTADSRDSSAAQVRYSFVPVKEAMTVSQFDGVTFDATTVGSFLQVAKSVSLTPHRRAERHDLVEIKHQLLIAPGYERLMATNPKTLPLEPLDRKLVRFAKQCLTRKKRQELTALLRDIELSSSDSEEAEELRHSVTRARSVIAEQDAALDAVAQALLSSGVLGEDRIAKAERAYGERYTEDRAAELQAKAEESLVSKRDELRRLEGALKDVQSKLQREEVALRGGLEEELAETRKTAHRAIANERDEFEKQRAELRRQQDLLQHNLAKVTQELREAGDEVVNRFLTIAPLLGLMNPTQSTHSQPDHVQSASHQGHGEPVRFELPAFVTDASTVAAEDVTEEAFFGRFKHVVEASGFSYRAIDLQRFHVSVKCGEITVLGGPSGTGKSSLPLLYARALRGGATGHDRPECLMVNINPSWMDIRDLLGHMNTLERRFYPAESGLFQYLVCAQEEHKTRGQGSGLYVACLDEMNLSQVEHYFSDLMMVLEREGDARRIQCFAPDIAGRDCVFREWGRIAISPAVRFVGTVNFDETTRLLSDRFLDRVNLIQLSSATLPSAAVNVGGLATARGRCVTLADFESWCEEAALPSELASLLDQARPLLNQMGQPMSPRVYRAICRFVGSASPIMTAPRAFDVQVAQRIIPKIRGLITKKQRDALDILIQLLKQSTICAFDESLLLLDAVRDSAVARGWSLEE